MLTTLKQADRALIQNLSAQNYWELKVHVVFSSVGENQVLYKVKPEHNLNGN